MVVFLYGLGLIIADLVGFEEFRVRVFENSAVSCFC